MIGHVIGNYRVVSELGKGGMGVVYRAEHVQLGRPAALKMLLPQMSSDPGIVQRFFNEARAASAIDHPGIVEVYDFGTHTDGRAYIVMALLKGESLDERLKAGPLPPVEGATIVAQVAAALAAAHARGIIHRDLKPDNIFLVPNELMPGGVQVKLLDFGIAKLADEQTAGIKTQTGALIGTPAYMSPEQCMGRADLDHRTDLYSLGCILFHVLCGRPPFTSDHGTGVMIAAHIRDAAPDPRSLNPNIPGALAAVVHRLLEKEPAARYQTAAELREALTQAGAAAPITRAPVADGYSATIASMPPQSRNLGPAAYGATAAPTTHSGAAGEVTTPATRRSRPLPRPGEPGAPPRKRGPWIALGLVLVAGAGIASFVALQGGQGTKSDPLAAAPVATGTPQASPPPPPATPPPAPPAPPLPAGAPAAAECAMGQVRNDDTHGHCCWHEQAWSTDKGRCVGLPRCPPGTVAKGEQCVASRSEVRSVDARPAVTPASTLAAPAPRFGLDAASYAPDTDIKIRFADPIGSPSGARAWLTVVEPSAPASDYGAWTFVDDGALTATLKAPSKPGSYEVRLHTDYPTKPHNVVHVEALTVRPLPAPATPKPPTTPSAKGTPGSAQRFTVARTTLHGGDRAAITFPGPMQAAPGERFWITVVEHGADDTAWGAYEYVPDGARSMTLAVPDAPGAYEIRLHANYPTKSTNVVHRVAVRVQ